MSEKDAPGKRIVIHVENAIHVENPPPPRPVGPCSVTKGPHRWAYLARGGQACGYCGKERR